MAEIAREPISAVERGEEELTTTEVVLHEVAFSLASKANDNRTVSEIVSGLRAILRMPGFRLGRGQKQRYFRALELWEDDPRLGFADAIVAASAAQQHLPLATFDRHFDRVAGIVLWQPPGIRPNGTGG
jgi:predicted nucleic acid-binding protein